MFKLYNFFKGLLFTPSMPESKRRGIAGENAAAIFLKRKRKMKILARNFRYLHTEIDIIAQDADSLVFVEVKTRSPDALVDGYYAAISKQKRAAVARCARAYMNQTYSRAQTWRYDVVEVRLTSDMKIVNLQHFENIPF